MLFQEWAGILAGILTLASGLMYVVGMVRGTTQPNRATHWVLLLLIGLTFLFYRAGGGTTWCMSIASLIAVFFAAVLSLRYGEGKGLTQLDRICVAVALLGIVGWLSMRLFGHSVLISRAALIMNLGADFAGLYPTLKKSWERPETEDFSAWVLAFASALVNLFAVRWAEVGSVFHPDVLFNGYLVIALGVLVAGLLRGRFASRVVAEGS